MTTTPDEPTELEMLRNRADVGALMLAASDDPDVLRSFIATVTPDEAGRLLGTALVLGGTMVRLGDRSVAAGDPKTPRAILEAALGTYREKMG